MEVIRAYLAAEGLPTECADDHIHELAASTNALYDRHWVVWASWCSTQDADPTVYDPVRFVHFLKTSPLSDSALNATRQAVSRT
ncbi:hypothetical protein H4S02_010611, partial [Coemansia sp. RSA 2611]